MIPGTPRSNLSSSHNISVDPVASLDHLQQPGKSLSPPRQTDSSSSTDCYSGDTSSWERHNMKNRVMLDDWLKTHVAFDAPRRDGTASGTIEQFLETFVPSDGSRPPEVAGLSNTMNAAVYDIATCDVNEDVLIPIMNLLQVCQSGFDIRNKITFQRTHGTSEPLLGPAGGEQYTLPDISGPYPGQPHPTRGSGWSKYCLSVQARTSGDPLTSNPELEEDLFYAADAIAQVVTDAKNLFSSSFNCFVFVIGVYTASRTICIYRFDRAGCVSCAFNFEEKPHILREFLWRLVHPRHGIPNAIVGSDETILIPTHVQRKQMRQRILQWDSNCEFYDEDCRWFRVHLNEKAQLLAIQSDLGIRGSADDDIPSTCSWPPESDEDSLTHPDVQESGSSAANGVRNGVDVYAYTFGKHLHRSSRLVSRATYVTMIMVKIGNKFYVLVLKDSWQPRNRRRENEFYERIQDRFEELKGRPQFGWVKEIYGDDFDSCCSSSVPGIADYYGYLDLMAVSSPYGSAFDRGHITAVNQGLDSEKSRIRIVTGPVGKSLEEFTSTKNLAISFRDAIVGHYIARCCGVLHRDISANNILTETNKTTGRVRGFIHDFNCASFIKCLYGLGKPGDNVDVDKAECRVPIGTYLFMSIGVLKNRMKHASHHDLESFYWVLVWILLRKGNHMYGENACAELFESPFKTKNALCMKYVWLVPYCYDDNDDDDEQEDDSRECLVPSVEKVPLVITDNEPLNTLLKDIRILFRQYHSHDRDKKPKKPTHQKMIEMVHRKIQLDTWPTNDGFDGRKETLSLIDGPFNVADVDVEPVAAEHTAAGSSRIRKRGACTTEDTKCSKRSKHTHSF